MEVPRHLVNSCHLLDDYGVDNEPTSPGHKGVRGGSNHPAAYDEAVKLMAHHPLGQDLSVSEVGITPSRIPST